MLVLFPSLGIDHRVYKGQRADQSDSPAPFLFISVEVAQWRFEAPGRLPEAQYNSMGDVAGYAPCAPKLRLKLTSSDARRPSAPLYGLHPGCTSTFRH